jgi:hypothetical protein
MTSLAARHCRNTGGLSPPGSEDEATAEGEGIVQEDRNGLDTDAIR